ncbi:conserved protein of unknown function [uncultured Sphingopyxis sp.]|uniref:T6SS Phospholipase effector Tle1-like catalytic domain-containing protein n=1 Tax=uncultured Sphingopyxis sp. TaxID=310581 RepID=A0A1Y5PXP0_9SPHN|nr:DUF2235 domain-containing protein [uncultured Sphingopyxis sp.]SBV32287.1 conserved protein of unknown function [uncultured Sphingopyxis sp.]
MAKAPASKTSAKQDKTPVRKTEGRNLVILCDGTGNELGGALADEIGDIRISNVLKLYRIAEKGQRQLVYYSPGVGTVGRVDWLYRWKQKFLGVLGLVTGYGLDDNLLGAYRFLAENWEEGDRIYIFGFSRGAWTARVLAGMLHLIGLVRPSQLNMCDNALATYKRAAKEDKLPIAWHFARVIGARYPGIHFVGVWDTVASVLVPRSDRMWIPSLETLPFTATNPSVRIFRHALALDERRRMFRVARWAQPQLHVPNRFRPRETLAQDIEQRWFAGVHSDIGGGYREDESQLSKIPLIWIISEARKAGLAITPANLRQFAEGEPKEGSEHVYSRPDPLGLLHKSLTWGWKPLEILPKAVRYREWRRRAFLGRYLPLAEPRLIAAEHVIDDSVHERRAKDATYRPANLEIR